MNEKSGAIKTKTYQIDFLSFADISIFILKSLRHSVREGREHLLNATVTSPSTLKIVTEVRG